jgi:hypothetical protein
MNKRDMKNKKRDMEGKKVLKLQEGKKYATK